MLDAPPDESAVRRVATLRNGETYSRALFIPGPAASPERIKTVKRQLAQSLSPVIARAKRISVGEFHLHTVCAFTRNYDVIVTGVVVRVTEILSDL
jgi:hypothetical protein